MASTNKTTNYNLSQFIGTDKPAWLSDYNQDMSKIDTGIKNASDAATGADGKADSANTAIGTLANLNTTDKTNLVSAINEVNTAAGAAQGTANNAAAAAAANRTSINAINSYFTLSQEADLTLTTSAGTADNIQLKVRSNVDGTLFKFYGRVNIANIQGSGLLTVTTSDTGLRPSEAITIAGSGLRNQTENGVATVKWQTYVLNPNGTITFQMTRGSNISFSEFYFFATLTFLENFNDPSSQA